MVDTSWLLLVRQIGLAMAGASSLWGLFFVWQSYRREESTASSIMYEWIARRLRIPFIIGFLMATFAWVGLSLLPIEAFAHEGIRLVPTGPELYAGLQLLTPIHIVWILVMVCAMFLRGSRVDFFRQKLGWFYSIQFAIVTLLIVFSSVGEYTSSEWGFFMFHGFHSIFTLGTVLVLDFMYLNVQRSVVAQQHLFPFFPDISKIVWAGLALDMLSVLLIFPEAVVLDSRFYFAQTVVAVLIINGVLLSGLITRRMHRAVSQGGEALTNKWILLSSVAGTISVTSWTAITVVDFFENIPFSYTDMLLLYGVVMMVLYLGHEAYDYYVHTHVPTIA